MDVKAEFREVPSFSFLHKSWFLHEMWPCIYYLNTFTQLFPHCRGRLGGCICAHELMQKKTILSSEESTAHISEKNNTLTISFSGPLRQGQGIYMQTLQLYWAVNSPHPSKLGCSSLLWKHATGQGWKGNSFYAMTLWRIPAIQFPQNGPCSQCRGKSRVKMIWYPLTIHREYWRAPSLI